MAKSLTSLGYSIVSGEGSPVFNVYSTSTCTSSTVKDKFRILAGGTENHLLLFDVRLQRDAKPPLDGARVAHVADRCSLVTNMNTIPGDRNALLPAGIRLGDFAMHSICWVILYP